MAIAADSSAVDKATADSFVADMEVADKAVVDEVVADKAIAVDRSAALTDQRQRAVSTKESSFHSASRIVKYR